MKVLLVNGSPHAHGCTYTAPDSWFTHIGMTTNHQKGDAEWLEPVTDEEYNNL